MVNPLSKSCNGFPIYDNTKDNPIGKTPSTPPIYIPKYKNNFHGYHFNYSSSDCDNEFEPSSPNSFDYYSILRKKKDNQTGSRNNVFSTSLSDDTTTSKIELAQKKSGSFSSSSTDEFPYSTSPMFEFEEELNDPQYFDNSTPDTPTLPKEDTIDESTSLQFGYEYGIDNEENLTDFFHIGDKKFLINWDNNDSRDFFDLDMLSFFKVQLEEHYQSTFNEMKHSALIYLYKKELEGQEPEYFLFYINNGPKLFCLREGQNPKLMTDSDLLNLSLSENTNKISFSG